MIPRENISMPYDPSNPTARDSPLQPSEQRRLEEANFLLENNKPAQAAPIFAKLAEVLRSARRGKWSSGNPPHPEGRRKNLRMPYQFVEVDGSRIMSA